MVVERINPENSMAVTVQLTKGQLGVRACVFVYVCYTHDSAQATESQDYCSVFSCQHGERCHSQHSRNQLLPPRCSSRCASS